MSAIGSMVHCCAISMSVSIWFLPLFSPWIGEAFLCLSIAGNPKSAMGNSHFHRAGRFRKNLRGMAYTHYNKIAKPPDRAAVFL